MHTKYQEAWIRIKNQTYLAVVVSNRNLEEYERVGMPHQIRSKMSIKTCHKQGLIV